MIKFIYMNMAQFKIYPSNENKKLMTIGESSVLINKKIGFNTIEVIVETHNYIKKALDSMPKKIDYIKAFPVMIRNLIDKKYPPRRFSMDFKSKDFSIDINGYPYWMIESMYYELKSMHKEFVRRDKIDQKYALVSRMISLLLLKPYLNKNNKSNKFTVDEYSAYDFYFDKKMLNKLNKWYSKALKAKIRHDNSNSIIAVKNLNERNKSIEEKKMQSEEHREKQSIEAKEKYNHDKMEAEEYNNRKKIVDYLLIRSFGIIEDFNSDAKLSGIYIAHNTKTYDFYIGSATNMLKRKREHLSALIDSKHGNKSFNQSYKEGVFKFNILEFVTDIGELKTVENRYLSRYEPTINNVLDAFYKPKSLKYRKKNN